MLRKAFAFAALGLALMAGPALAGATHAEPKDVHWSFEGPFGKFDTAQVQRGYKVYREVCSACHSMEQMYFRNLGQKGGPFYDEKYKNPNDNPYVKSLAKDLQVKDIDADTGDVIQRPAGSADRFPAPFPNEPAARAANGGALPPDLSVIVKAREGGPQYVYSILTGYKDPPPGLKTGPNQYYNPYMSGDMTSSWSGKGPVPEGGFIAMPPPLVDGRVTFDDKSPSMLSQEAKDVVAYLAWASDPKATERKEFGLGAMIYLFFFSVLLWFSYRRVWKNIGH
ncbi:cytochrome c1 [Phenylobacterium sp.]|uniref:cytochrome c1 n=1 Tax=Phenylobacterium sp. TaxID=1871053 RepID=UPI0025FBB0F7|nr:cytochrome c1 [Phenylobacterium sp.]